MRGLLDAVTFLTRVPAGAEVHDDTRLTRAVPWFAIVGAAVGALVAAVYAGLLFVLPPLLCAVVAVGLGVLVTGAFHEDGLADVADAFGGGSDREDRLRILKDPRLGTYGVLALVFSLLVRIVSVAVLSRPQALLAIPAAHALARAAAVGAMAVFPTAGEGLGASYTRTLSRRSAGLGVLAGVAIAAALLLAAVVPAAAVGVVSIAIVGRMAIRKVGGITGDVLGAIEQVTEMGVLVFAAGHFGA